jgi:hypothetical protein
MIVRRYEPVEFRELMRKISPIYSGWLKSSNVSQDEPILLDRSIDHE